MVDIELKGRRYFFPPETIHGANAGLELMGFKNIGSSGPFVVSDDLQIKRLSMLEVQGFSPRIFCVLPRPDLDPELGIGFYRGLFAVVYLTHGIRSIYITKNGTKTAKKTKDIYFLPADSSLVPAPVVVLPTELIEIVAKFSDPLTQLHFAELIQTPLGSLATQYRTLIDERRYQDLLKLAAISNDEQMMIQSFNYGAVPDHDSIVQLITRYDNATIVRWYLDILTINKGEIGSLIEIAFKYRRLEIFRLLKPYVDSLDVHISDYDTEIPEEMLEMIDLRQEDRHFSKTSIYRMVQAIKHRRLDELTAIIGSEHGMESVYVDGIFLKTVSKYGLVPRFAEVFKKNADLHMYHHDHWNFYKVAVQNDRLDVIEAFCNLMEDKQSELDEFASLAATYGKKPIYDYIRTRFMKRWNRTPFIFGVGYTANTELFLQIVAEQGIRDVNKLLTDAISTNNLEVVKILVEKYNAILVEEPVVKKGVDISSIIEYLLLQGFDPWLFAVPIIKSRKIELFERLLQKQTRDDLFTTTMKDLIGINIYHEPVFDQMINISIDKIIASPSYNDIFVSAIRAGNVTLVKKLYKLLRPVMSEEYQRMFNIMTGNDIFKYHTTKDNDTLSRFGYWKIPY
jgi:hypothetical protein